MSESDRKWSCEYCTYENYPSSLKCTMCRGPRPFISEDIYRLNDDNKPGPCNTQQRRQKWLCDTCNYTNPSREMVCLQCGHPYNSIVTANNLHEQVQPLRISQNSDLAQCLSTSRNSSPPIMDTTRRNQKWMCPLCTYENWPKTKNCAMCGTNVPKCQQTPSSPSDKNLLIDTQDKLINSDMVNNIENEQPRKLRNNNIRRSNNADWNWLNACIGVIEGDSIPVETYLSSGGNPTRQLTANEVKLLNRNSAFDVGHTLVHLAIRFQREDLLAVLLSQIEGGGGGNTTTNGVKRVPSYVAPDLAADIRRLFASTIRQRKSTTFPCNYVVNDFPTFSLPSEIDELPSLVQEQLFNELLDKDAQLQLESDPAVINWSLELTVRLGSRLYALWNRSSGDCLLDSVMQATWGVFDRDNTLRRTLAESLNQSGHMFYPRWKEYEASQASFLQYSLDENQWEEDWSSTISLANQPGTSLEQLHVFALAHILRRPIIVYGVKYVKSFRGEALGYARFEGVYLPLLWEQTFCIRTPIALGYTRGHFSALVPIEPYNSNNRNCLLQTTTQATQTDHRHHQIQNSIFLPLMDRDRKLLPIHFLNESELGREETILRQWLDVCETEGGILVAQQILNKRPLLVAQMIEEWLNYYRRLTQMTSAPFSRPIPIQDYLSEGETDDE